MTCREAARGPSEYGRVRQMVGELGEVILRSPEALDEVELLPQLLGIAEIGRRQIR